jgi:chorismate mutase / prephenate dehydrogenase
VTEMEVLRGRILEIDEAILKLWKERNDAARRIGAIKQQSGLPLQNFEVEKTVLEHAETSARPLGLLPEPVRALMRILIESSVALQEKERIQSQAGHGRTALVVGGAGRMGVWFVRFLQGQGFQVFVDDPAPAFQTAPPSDLRPDLVVIATPPSTVAEVLDKYATKFGKQTLLFDIASIKGETATLLRRLATDGFKVASLHPMFGPSVDVLMGRNVLLLDCGSKQGLEEAQRLFSHTTAKTTTLPVEMHDPVMAEVLGLSHATSLVFNAALMGSPFAFRQLEQTASTTFRKQVEVAREVARENARLYFEIQTLNPDNAKMLQRLEEAVKDLRGLILKRDRLGFVDRMHRAQAYYEGVELRSK